MTKPKHPPPPPSALGTVNKAVVLLDENLNRLRKAMKLNKDFDVVHVNMIAKLAQKAGELLDATRKHEQGNIKEMSALSNEEKRDVFIEYFAELSKPHQREMFQVIHRLTWGDPDLAQGVCSECGHAPILPGTN